MANPFLGEIRIVSFGFAPKGWAECNGQALAISQNTALFALMGTTYGGDGVRTFLLPNLQGRAAVHTGSIYPQRSAGGEVNHTLTAAEMPAHSHALGVRASPGTTTNPVDSTFAQAALGLGSVYGAEAAGSPVSGMIGNAGGGQAHLNQQPYLVVNFVIALQGISPSKN